MAVAVVIGLGSNLGQRLESMHRAVELLGERVELQSAAAIYETAPMYVTDQPAFLNSAVRARSELGPLALLRALKDVEARIGRRPAERFGPREIDLDLILFGELQYRFWSGSQALLQVPHPGLKERRFVLQPLADLGIERLPGLGQLADLLAATEAQAAHVIRMENAELPIHC